MTQNTEKKEPTKKNSPNLDKYLSKYSRNRSSNNKTTGQTDQNNKFTSFQYNKYRKKIDDLKKQIATTPTKSSVDDLQNGSDQKPNEKIKKETNKDNDNFKGDLKNESTKEKQKEQGSEKRKDQDKEKETRKETDLQNQKEKVPNKEIKKGIVKPHKESSKKKKKKIIKKRQSPKVTTNKKRSLIPTTNIFKSLKGGAKSIVNTIFDEKQTKTEKSSLQDQKNITNQNHKKEKETKTLNQKQDKKSKEKKEKEQQEQQEQQEQKQQKQPKEEKEEKKEKEGSHKFKKRFKLQTLKSQFQKLELGKKVNKLTNSTLPIKKMRRNSVPYSNQELTEKMIDKKVKKYFNILTTIEKNVVEMKTKKDNQLDHHLNAVHSTLEMSYQSSQTASNELMETNQTIKEMIKSIDDMTESMNLFELI
ncbi:hypothetical protein M0812_15002 [Anaeramoeba flamelloides]|uniref:Uncharacterized protein n=1 Tax=Anaeramoeba flamelloides TaxID=1746091 RepID=A0AAV7ZAB2_9EUKA|nr:hypothetical protein M0812_15002 [Anaeramoeba flamelloides]